MSHRTQIIAAVITLAAISIVHAATPGNNNDVFHSIVDIWTVNEDGEYTGGGSGTIISADGIILTNAHVVTDEQGNVSDVAEICYFVSEFEIPSCEELAVLVAYDPDYDLALLWPVLRYDSEINDFREIEGFERLYPNIEVSPNVLYLNELPNIRDTIDVVGYPAATGTSQISVTRGIITGNDSYPLEDGTVWVDSLLTDATINTGNSGGAVLDENDRFIGIPTAFSLSGEGGQYGYIIPVTTISDWIDTLVEEGVVQLNPFQQESPLRPSADEERSEADILQNSLSELSTDVETLTDSSRQNTRQIEYLWIAVGVLLLVQLGAYVALRKKSKP